MVDSWWSVYVIVPAGAPVLGGDRSDGRIEPQRLSGADGDRA